MKHLRRSVAHFEDLELPVEVAKTRLALGQTYGQRSRKEDRARACKALLAARTAFDRLDAPAIFENIEKSLEDLDCEP